MKTQTKTQNNTGKTFAEVFQEFMNDCNANAKKNSNMNLLVEQAEQEIEQEIQAQGFDMVLGSMQKSLCPCGCGTVEVKAEFIGFKMEADRVGVTEGVIQRIISVE